ncbi:MAG TPA: sterol desaturase family protein [Nitrospira sp.]|nr:sterol desaturase family protein [Nitrospira sp.]
MGIEDLIRLGSYLSVLAVMATWELLAPRRTLTAPKLCRWVGNLTIVILNTAIARLLFVGGVVAAAVMAEKRGWGLLNWINGPAWVELALAVLALDLIIYLQHQVFHAVPILWRFHMMHHSDLDLDVSSGVRFHPVEIMISTMVKIMAVLTLGVAPLAVVVFEIVLNGMALFSHSNVKLPVSAEPILRWFVVTPDMHRIHHSTNPLETNSNYGFNVPWWDRLFGTYCAEPALGQVGMKIGLEHLGPPVCLNLFRMLQFPFVTKLGRYADRIEA